MMKTVSRLLPLFLVLALLTACEQDVYDKGDNEYSNMRADFVEAFVGNNMQVDYVITDDDVRLQLTDSYTGKWIQRSDTTYRAVLYYDYVGEKARPKSMAHVPTIPVKKLSQFKSGIKTDPLGMESVWLSGSRKYLNLCLILKTGAVDEEAKVQSLGIIGDTITVGPDGLRTYQLRVYHSQGGVPQYYSQRVYFSIPVSGLEADSLHLSINTYNGVVAKGIRL